MYVLCLEPQLREFDFDLFNSIVLLDQLEAHTILPIHRSKNQKHRNLGRGG